MDDLKIKHLKPSKTSRYTQGAIDPKSCKKYFAEAANMPIIYRSSLELMFIKYCEATPSITKWASEPIAIPYYSRLTNKTANYYPDYIIESENGSRTIVEIKPAGQTVKPKPTDSRWLKESYIKNVDKWKAAKQFAEDHGMKFLIVTEKFFG